MAKALQTKLSKEQKEILKGYRKEMFQDAEFYQDADDSLYTVMVAPACEGIPLHNSNYVRVAIAVQGFTEEKFRAKAGLYAAMQRMNNDEYITIQDCDLVDLLCAFSLGNVDAQPFAK